MNEIESKIKKCDRAAGKKGDIKRLDETKLSGQSYCLMTS